MMLGTDVETTWALEGSAEPARTSVALR